MKIKLELGGYRSCYSTARFSAAHIFGILLLILSSATHSIAKAGGAAPETRAGAETLAFKNSACVLLEELLNFKDEPKFKEFGFSIGGPYNQWLKRVEAFRDSTPKGIQHPIPFEVRTVSTDLLLIGLDFMQKGETQFIRTRLPEVKERIDFQNYLAEKSKKTMQAPLRFRIWRDSTGKFNVDAALTSKNQSHVTLRKRDGKTIIVPLVKLSEYDLNLLSREPSEWRGDGIAKP